MVQSLLYRWWDQKAQATSSEQSAEHSSQVLTPDAVFTFWQLGSLPGVKNTQTSNLAQMRWIWNQLAVDISWIWRVSSQLEQPQSFVVARLEQVNKNLGLGFGTCSPKKTTPVSNLQWFSPEIEIVWIITKLMIFTGKGCSACTQSKHGNGEKGNNGRESSHISPTWAKDIWNRFFSLDLN